MDAKCKHCPLQELADRLPGSVVHLAIHHRAHGTLDDVAESLAVDNEDGAIGRGVNVQEAFDDLRQKLIDAKLINAG